MHRHGWYATGGMYVCKLMHVHCACYSCGEGRLEMVGGTSVNVAEEWQERIGWEEG